ncbi:LIC12162 family transferase [Silvanigrella aquatica]|uniref:Transferase n=1 Tax=Silvanigrella aquatica TaxID=1915309 RepID=A0A1L4D2Z4_9BACT|nr:LIC12162 family protein [Silvanigrella aquatica]APJ04573.1 hypothetical protein AXG55_11915 [Silvanigrella aquatica]
MLLVTTPIEKFWDAKKDILFLGEYCKHYSRKEYWQTLNFSTFHTIWSDSSKKKIYANYLNSIQEKTIEYLVEKLNEVHGTKFSKRYWRILLTPFLMHYIPNFFDKYIHILEVKKMFPHNLSTIILSEESFFDINLAEEFISEMVKDEWNLQITSQIIQKIGDIKICDIKKLERKDQKIGLMYELKCFLKNIITFLLMFILRKSSIRNFCQQLPLIQSFSLYFFSFFEFVPCKKIKIKKNKYLKNNMEMRSIFSSYKDVNDDKFCDILMQSFEKNFPLQFIEGFEYYFKKAKFLYGSKCPKVIIQDTSIYSDSLFAMWFAYCIEKGTKSIGFQHGGGYGDRLYNPSQNFELKVNDYYISWGWKKEGYNILPLPSPIIYIPQKKLIEVNNNKDIMLVGTVIPQHFIRYDCQPIDLQFLEYLNWELRFYQSISKEISSNFYIRTYPVDYNWNIKKRLLNNSVRVNSKKNFQEALLNCKIFVSDNLNTTFLYSLAINKPTILFWDQNLWESTSEALHYYSILEKAGIFHRNPESAALKINEIYYSVDLWWKSEEIQKARLLFVENYAKTSDCWERVWVKEIKNLIRY